MYSLELFILVFEWEGGSLLFLNFAYLHRVRSGVKSWSKAKLIRVVALTNILSRIATKSKYLLNHKLGFSQCGAYE